MLCFKESGRISQTAWGFVVWSGDWAWPMQFRACRERPGARGPVSRTQPHSSKLSAGHELQPGEPVGVLARKHGSEIQRPANQTLWEGSTETKEAELRIGHRVSSGCVPEFLRWAVRNHRGCHKQSSEVSRETLPWRGVSRGARGLSLVFLGAGQHQYPFCPWPRKNYGRPQIGVWVPTS